MILTNFTMNILTILTVRTLARVSRTQTPMSIKHMSLQLVRQTKPGQSPQFHINVNVSKGRTFEEISILK